jgi:hypothetical protein
MAFFQNKNTFTIPQIVQAGFDVGVDQISDVSKHNWTDFLSDSIHTERKRAFQEFIFLMFYYQYRKIDGAKFPHNLLINKVLRFFYTHNHQTLTISGEQVHRYIPQSGGTNLFTISATDAKATIASGVSGLPDLLPSSDYPNILANIKANMMAGNTSLGFFEEAATAFSYFYLTRQLIIINGHDWVYNDPLAVDASDIVVRRESNDVYGVVPKARTIEIVNEIVGKADTQLPYFFNALIHKLKDGTGYRFNIPNIATVSTDNDKIFLAHFIKMLDPYRCMGRGSYISPSLSVTTASNYDPGNGFSSTANAIVITPDLATNDNYPNNNFIEDLFVLMRSGNGGYADLSGFTATTTVSSRPFYSKKSGSFTVVTPSSDYTKLNPFTREINRDLFSVYDDIKSVIKKSIQSESICILNIMYTDLTDKPTTEVIASGVGEVTVALLGVKNLGMPLFSYNLVPDNNYLNLKPSSNQSGTKKINISKKQAIHFGGFGLDLGSGQPSPFEIDAGKLGKFRFQLVSETSPTSTELLKDIKVNVLAVANMTIVNVLASGAVGAPIVSRKYYKTMNIKGTVLTANVIVAEYFVDRRDLVIESFTKKMRDTFELDEIIDIKYTVASGAASGSVEELVTFVSIFEEEAVRPEVISEEVIYGDDTFQLYGLPSGDTKYVPVGSTSSNNLKKFKSNKESYKALFTDTDSKTSIEYILDYLKKDYDASILTVPETAKVTFEPLILKGSFVGKPAPIPLVPSQQKDPRVVADTDYKKKFSSGSKIEGSNQGWYDILRYSRAKITINPTLNPVYPPLEISHTVSMEIISHVSPAISSLANQFIDTPGAEHDAKAVFDSVGPASNSNVTSNQVLAMLRSFGLLEAIVQKMIQITNTRKKVLRDPITNVITGMADYFTSLEKEYIVNRLKEWLPDSAEVAANSAETAALAMNPSATPSEIATARSVAAAAAIAAGNAILCKDEQFTGLGTIHYAADLNLTDYYTIKRL